MMHQPDGSRVGLVHHVMDLYPDAAIAPGVLRERSLAARIFDRITERTLASSDAVIALGRDMRDRILRRFPRGARAEAIHVVQPWAEGDLLRPIDKTDNPLAKTLGLDRTFNLVYSGNLGIAHDLQTMIGAIDQTKRDPTLKWVFIGGGNRFEQLKSTVQAQGWNNVEFLPFQDRDQLNYSLNLADVHLISQHPAFTGVVVPSKLFGILAVGKPSLMIGPADAEVSRIIDEDQVGYVVANDDVNGLLKRINDLRNDRDTLERMGRDARRVFEQNYDREVACSRIEQILRDVVKFHS
jgi:colanic acid biosynthesis glycosyl transferase WcaI